jgi:hypothetical protein
MINDVFSPTELRMIAAHPHLIGWMVGKTKLTEMHSKWIRDLWLPSRNTALQAHRNGYKTTAVTEVGIVWRLLFHPDNRIALMRETWSTSNDTLKTIAEYMKHELVQELFRALHGAYPIATTSRDGRLSYAFKGTITKEGSVDAFGVDNLPTGSHYDDFLADDVVTIKDRFSRAKREATRESLREVITNIMDPGCYVRIVGTPWAKMDAWEMLRKMGIEPATYDVYQTGIFSQEQIEEKQRLTTRSLFAANYLLKMINSDENIFGEPTFGEWLPGQKAKIVAHIDAAYGGKDTTALTVMQRRNDGAIQAWGKRYIGHVEGHVPAIQAELQARGCRWICMEDNGDKGFLAKLMRKRQGDYLLRAETYHETQNKHVKIVAYLGHNWHDIIWATDTDEEYMAQDCDYAEGLSPDDCPDSGASLLRQVFFPTEGHSASWRSLYE